MQTAALLVVLAAAGGFIVVRTVFREGAPRSPVAAGESATEPLAGLSEPCRSVDQPTARRRRRLLTAAALTDALAIDGEMELRPSFFGRTLAFGRLVLVILFICALAGGTLFWLAMMIASKAHIHPS
jgi:hypothetical protein